MTDEILKDILSELQYQTRLMEKIYEMKDDQDHGKRKVIDSIENLKIETSKYPGLMDSPIGMMLNQVFDTIGKG